MSVGRIVAAVVLVASAGYWTWLDATDRVGFRAELTHEGTVVLSLYDVVEVLPDGVRVDKGGESLVLVGDVDALKVGDAFSAGATHQADGTWRADWVEPHPHRRAKHVLGIVGLLGTAMLVGLGFQVRDRRLWARG